MGLGTEIGLLIGSAISDAIDEAQQRAAQERAYQAQEAKESFINDIENIVKKARKNVECRRDADTARHNEKENARSERIATEKQITAYLAEHPEKERCQDCNQIFDKSELRKCRKCGAIICNTCRKKHKCGKTSYYTVQAAQLDAKYAAEEERRLADVQAGEAAFQQASYEENNVRASRDLTNALPNYISAAEAGNKDAQLRLAYCYQRGDILKQNPDEAAFWFNEAASDNLEIKQLVAPYLFQYYSTLRGIPDINKIKNWYSHINFGMMNDSVKAELNNLMAISYYRLGECYYKGKGVARNIRNAAALLTKGESCDNQIFSKYNFCKDTAMIADAQFELGLAYETADHIEQNIENAIAWYAKAAENNNPRAQQRLAVLFEDGRYRQQNIQESVSWYMKAAENGFAPAQFKISKCYYEGTGVPQNSMKVKYWLKKAIEQDNKDAIEFLAAHSDIDIDGMKHITYQASGDIIQGNVGVFAKDDAVVNRANVSVETNSMENQVNGTNQATPSEDAFKFCIYCGEKLPKKAKFCSSCGAKQE